MIRMLRVLLGTLLLGLIAAIGTAGPVAAAEDEIVIDHSEYTTEELRLLVTVPGNAPVDLDSISVTIGGAPTTATAELANAATVVRRSTILAIDTSKSMRGERIAAAKRAALTYLDTVPSNVEVGVVTFDNEVAVRQAPSLDRDASRSVIDGLTLELNTALYAGVRTSVETLQALPGQRQVLVLSDGQDNTKTALQPLVKLLAGADIRVDVVSLEQGSTPPEALAAMANASGGRVISAETDALTAAFSDEADVLARQILVTAALPAGMTDNDASVSVTLAAAGVDYSGSAFVSVKDPAAPATPSRPTLTVPDNNAMNIPTPLLYAALAGIALGTIGIVMAFAAPAEETRVSLTDQLQIYSASEETARISRAKLRKRNAVTATSLTETAKLAAEKALSTNVGVEAKIAQRLEGAGMALKASEWLLLHTAIAFVAGIMGLMLSGGSPIAMALFLFFGALGPWVYLAVKRSRRLKAFDAGLADSLQLMSGSLSAGLSLAQSMDTIVREGAEPITSEFKRAIVESRLGVGLEDALEGISERMQSTDFKWVVMAIRIQREVGGNLAELLLTVAATLREREYLRRHVRALSAEGRLSTWILGGLPPVFLGYLALSKPDYVEPMFTTPIGWLMLAGMGVLLAVGIFWMSRVVKVEI